GVFPDATPRQTIDELETCGAARLSRQCSIGNVSTRTVQQVALRHARDLAGGISFLARRIGVPADTLDAMVHGRESIPNWIFLRTVDYINEAEATGTMPPGLPENWRDLDSKKP